MQAYNEDALLDYRTQVCQIEAIFQSNLSHMIWRLMKTWVPRAKILVALVCQASYQVVLLNLVNQGLLNCRLQLQNNLVRVYLTNNMSNNYLLSWQLISLYGLCLQHSLKQEYIRLKKIVVHNQQNKKCMHVNIKVTHCPFCFCSFMMVHSPPST